MRAPTCLLSVRPEDGLLGGCRIDARRREALLHDLPLKDFFYTLRQQDIGQYEIGGAIKAGLAWQEKQERRMEVRPTFN